MKTVNISLSSVEKVKNFVNIVSKYEGEVDIVADRYVVDAKSIMGIFSLDIGKPLKLNILNDAEADQLIAELKPFTE